MKTQIFDDIAGQDRAIEYLNRTFEDKRLTHAYLISGASEKTRSLLAKRFAYCILADSINGLADSAADEFSCADLHEVKPQSAGAYLIEQIRQISADANLAPIQYKKKVYIFHDADCLRGAPANALLKTLEEPPADVVCILLAQNYASVLETLQSRCVLLKLNAEKMQLDKDSSIFDLLYKIANRAKSAKIFDEVQSIKELAQSKSESLNEQKEEQLDTYKDYFSASARKELDTQYKREAKSICQEEIMHQLLMIKLWLRDCLLLKNGAVSLMTTSATQQGVRQEKTQGQGQAQERAQDQNQFAANAQEQGQFTAAAQGQGVDSLEKITQVSAQCSEKGLLKAIDAVKKCEQEIHYNVGLDIALEAMFFEIRRALCQ